MGEARRLLGRRSRPLRLDQHRSRSAGTVSQPLRHVRGDRSFETESQAVRKEIQRNYAALANDAACGCWNTSFNACITTSVERNCSLCIPSQIAFFCPPDDVDGVDSGHGNFRLCDVPRPNCTVQKALHRLRTRYKAVGLEEQMHASVELFEHLLPRFFAGATARAASMTARSNPLPMATRSSSGVSQSVRALLMGAGNFEAEQLFYHAAKLEFVKALREAQLPQTT